MLEEKNLLTGSEYNAGEDERDEHTDRDGEGTATYSMDAVRWPRTAPCIRRIICWLRTVRTISWKSDTIISRKALECAYLFLFCILKHKIALCWRTNATASDFSHETYSICRPICLLNVERSKRHFYRSHLDTNILVDCPNAREYNLTNQPERRTMNLKWTELLSKTAKEFMVSFKCCPSLFP